jgi:hypothetical protein
MTIKPFVLAFLLFCSYSYGQMEQYNYKREISKISDQWHNIILPNDIFGKVKSDLSDIRIFGVIANKDTIEAPYLIQKRIEEVSNKEVNFKTLNVSQNEKGYFFTFEVPNSQAINQIKLRFKQRNFDWNLKLEGSQNQKEWFTVIEDYRVLSIKNEQTDFQFTKLSFPSSKYRFFRILIDSKEKPELTFASIVRHQFSNESYRDFTIKNILVNENQQLKQTEVDIDLQMPVPISKINFNISANFEYYRPFTVKYLADSFITEKGWKYNYQELTNGTLNSIEENDFKFNSTTVQKLKILIHNQNNQALTIDSIQIKGYVHELIARFTSPATYFLTYGNNQSTAPNYDIKRFKEKIPKNLNTLELSNEQIIQKEKVKINTPLFQNKFWLWLVMGIIILLIGWFSIKMISK